MIQLVAGKDFLTLQLQQDAQGWSYVQDPYVKIDAGKVKSFLESIQEIEAEKFASHSSAAADKFGLSDPWFVLTLTPTEGRARQITVTNEGESKANNRYAVAAEVPGVLVLASETAAKMAKKLKDFKE